MQPEGARRDHFWVGCSVLVCWAGLLSAALPFYLNRALLQRPGTLAAAQFFSTVVVGAGVLLLAKKGDFPARGLLTASPRLGAQTAVGALYLIAGGFVTTFLASGVDLFFDRILGVEIYVPRSLPLGGGLVADLLTLAAVAVTGPLFEELLFRGVLLGVLTRYGQRYALCASTLLFALLYTNAPQMISAAVMGLALGLLTQRTGSVLPALCAHLLYNIYVMFVNVAMASPFGVLAAVVSCLFAGLGFFAIIYGARLLVRLEVSIPRDPQVVSGWRYFWRAPTVWLTVLVGLALTLRTFS